MEADNIFTDQVKVCRPVFLKLLVAVSVTVISDSRDIVGQRVKPYMVTCFGSKVTGIPHLKEVLDTQRS